MKKGKIHPSPAAASSPGSASGDAIKVLRLLPAAILALTAVMRNEDKEVLAYLITRSMSGSVAVGDERRRCQRSSSSKAHRPALDCGCFECYTSFWSRWDCSPNRELIHQVIEVFEEHLASTERAGVRPRRRDRGEKKGRRAKEEKQMKKMEDVAVETVVSLGDGSATVASEDEKDGENQEATLEVTGREAEAEAAVDGEKRRGWADVMLIFNSRLWSLWSPAD